MSRIVDRVLRGAAGLLCFATPLGLMSTAFLQSTAGPGVHDSFVIMRLLFGCTGVLLVVVFAIYAARSPTVPPAKRSLWIVIILFGNIFVLPFFWYWYVRNGALSRLEKKGSHVNDLNQASKELGEVYDDYFLLSDTLRSDGERILDDPNTDQTWRRNLVRVAWPMIEAYGSVLRRQCIVFSNYCELELSPKHRRLLEDESNFQSSERIKESLKLAIKLLELDRPMDFSDENWQCVREAIVVRDRITHPMKAADLEIGDEEWVRIHSGMTWMLRGFTDFFDQVNQKYGPQA